MSQPYIGEIRMVGFNFVPVGWAFCDGSLLSISEYDVLFNLIGTTYGGDGTTNFALPDLRGRIPVHVGTGYVLAQKAGTETVTLNLSEIPGHTHALNVQTAAGNKPSPAGGVWAASSLEQFTSVTPSTSMASSALTQAGGDQPHSNLSTYQAVNFVIALFGVYPVQN